MDRRGEDPARALLRATLLDVRRPVAWCIVAGVAWQAVAVAVPYVLERAVDDGIVDGDADARWRWSIVLVALGFARWIGDAARHWWVERAGSRAADGLRRRLVDRLLDMGDDDLARFGQGDLVARSVSDTNAIWGWVSGIATLVTSVFTLVAVLVLLVGLDPALAAIGLATVPVAAVFAVRQVDEHGRLASEAAGATGGYTGVVESAVVGVRTIKGLGAEGVVLTRAEAAGQSLIAGKLALARSEARWLALAAAIPAAGVVAGLWVGGNKVIDGSMTAGTVVAFAGWMGLLVTGTVTLTQRLVDRGAANAAAERLAEVLGATGTPTPAEVGAIRPAGAPGRDGTGLVEVAMVGATATRGDRTILRDVSIGVAGGTWLALVGPTGGGTSTLLRLLAGLDQPAAGRVLLAGVDIATLAHSELRSAVAFVPQGASVPSGSVREILRVAAPGATDDELAAAVTASAAHDVVAEIGGLDAMVGERGLTLSGGQRQRLALAGAVARRPAVLLLDDTTSALDPATESALLASLRAYLPGTTVVVATHRAATAAACEAAVWVADGVAIELSRDAAVDALVAGGEGS